MSALTAPTPMKAAHPDKAHDERHNKLCPIAADHPEQESDQRKPSQSFRPYDGVRRLQVGNRRPELIG